MKKYVNRTFVVKTGKQLIPDYDNRTFTEKEVTFFDNDKIPDNVTIESETTVKVRMEQDKFFELGEKIEA